MANGCMAVVLALAGIGAVAPAPAFEVGVSYGPTIAVEGTGHRPVRLRVAAPPELRDRSPRWRFDLSAAVTAAGDVLLPHLGRQLEVYEVVSWARPPTATPDDALFRLRSSVPRQDADVVVGLLPAPAAGSPAPDPEERVGSASYPDGYLVLVVTDSLRDVGLLLAHEVAHLFGALDRPGHDGLMDPRALNGHIDAINAELLRLHRGRRFGRRPILDAEAREAALELYRRAGGQLPGPAALEARRHQAFLEEEGGDARRAIEIYREMIGVQPHDHLLFFDLGRALRQTGDTGAAIDAWEGALALAPGFVPALSKLGGVYAEIGRAEEAVAVLERAVALGGEDPEALANLAFARLLAGDPDGARRMAADLLARHPDLASAHNTLGMVFLKEGETREAIAALERAVRLDRTYAAGFVNLAQALGARGDWAAAEAAAERAVALRPAWWAARAARGLVHLQRGRWREAEGDLEDAVRGLPASAIAWTNLAAARFMLGDLDGAEDAALRALELQPRQPQTLVTLGAVAARRGDPEEAARRYEQAVEAAPAYGDGHLNLGHARFSLGQLEAAEAAYRRALELGVSNGLLHNNLATIYLRLGDLRRARRELQAAVEAGFRPADELVAAIRGVGGGERRERRERREEEGGAPSA